MARRPPPVEGIRRLEAPEARQAIAPLHAYLRECILNGTLGPGTTLSQVGLAAQLGVSRTPLREVLRMLQDEGLVVTEANQRTRVADIDPAELDDTYATRILVETLALSLTLATFGAREAREGKRLLTAMRRASRVGDLATWFGDHTAFHLLITSGAGAALRRQQQLLADRSIRYIRVYQRNEPTTWQEAGDVEHARILAALTSEDGAAAVAELARHLSRTALRVLHDCEPTFVPVAVPQAVELVNWRPSSRPSLTPSESACTLAE